MSNTIHNIQARQIRNTTLVSQNNKYGATIGWNIFEETGILSQGYITHDIFFPKNQKS